MRQKDLDAIDDTALGFYEGSNIGKNHAVEIPPDTDLNDSLPTLCRNGGVQAKWLDDLTARKRREVTCGTCQRILRNQH